MIHKRSYIAAKILKELHRYFKRYLKSYSTLPRYLVKASHYIQCKKQASYQTMNAYKNYEQILYALFRTMQSFEV